MRWEEIQSNGTKEEQKKRREREVKKHKLEKRKTKEAEIGIKSGIGDTRRAEHIKVIKDIKLKFVK